MKRREEPDGRIRVKDAHGRMQWVTPGPGAPTGPPIRKPKPVCKVLDSVPCDPQYGPAVHVLGSLDPDNGAIELALTGAWTFYEGMQLMWSMLHDDLADLPEDIEAVTVHAGLPAPGCWTTFPGFTIDRRQNANGIFVPFAVNTEGGEEAESRCRPCASVSRAAFIKRGWKAFY